MTKEEVLNCLSKVVEPDLKKDLVELDLIENLEVSDGKISCTVKVNNPAMHNRKRIEEACHFQLTREFGEDVEIDISITGLGKERDSSQRKVLPNVKNIICVASGKGGVGKSTITANLAAGLAKKGFKVGLIDADIYGPSVPIMFDCVRDKPQGIEKDGRNYIQPIEQHGVKIMSIGFFADVNQAVVWRGPMASKALTQMISDVYWGELDYMLIDLPPGTGDVHLSLIQAVPLSGAVIVTTPQEVALMDARKGIAMFELDSLKIPVLGVVENMSYFTPAELPDNKYYIFGQHGGERLAASTGVALIGEIPLVQSIREAGDTGRPAVLQDNTIVADAMMEMVDKFVERVEWRNENLAPTQMVKMEG